MRTDLLVTGFGPFLDIRENPSALLAQASGLPFRVLEVSFDGVDRLIDRLGAHPPKRLLLIGVAGNARQMRLEHAAHNRVSATADVRGVIRGPGAIEPGGPETLRSTLWESLSPIECDLWSPSEDAGDYLCNYALYRALQKLADTQIGFLHVPRLETWDLDRQNAALIRLLRSLRPRPRRRSRGAGRPT